MSSAQRYIMSDDPQTINETWKGGELFTWHGAELVVIPIMMVTGIVGNLLVLYIYHFRWRSSTVTLIKKMLAALDLTSLLLVYPPLVYMTLHPDTASFQFTCIFTAFVALETAMASACVLIIIAVDRFMRLCLLRKSGVQTGLVKKLSAAGILLSGIINIPCGWIFGKGVVSFQRYKVKIAHCFITPGSDQTTIFLIYTCILGLIFLFVFTTLFVIYYKIIKTLRELSTKHDQMRHTNSISRRPETTTGQTQSDVMKQSALVFIAITVVFFTSYSLYFVAIVLSIPDISIVGDMGPSFKALYDLAKLSPLVNNVANPIIYSFTSDRFRDEVKRMLTFKSCHNGLFQKRACSLGCNLQEVTQSATETHV
ncbi:unnamed protein product [Candidula unifasciata]|uniref:G-protein coupled receptors family 1 profile domain-containing protein n=1 Tax=Candidula unifasciata TaxID=100452 RepID=A0A8S3Z8W6_9EUPU|nr:unnamed protein product [Candidula unifasciata]